MKIDRVVVIYLRRYLKIAIGLLCTLAFVFTTNLLDLSIVSAQSPPVATPTPTPPIEGKNLKVATRMITPFVIEDNGELGGFSIELWKNIALELDVKSSFQKFDNVTNLLNAVKSNQSDLGISAISVTSQREQSFDFSQPIFDSGLQILVRSQGQQGAIGRIVNSLLTPTLFQLLGIMALIILIPAHIVWWVERKHEGGFLEDSAYFPGIFKACWWAAATGASQFLFSDRQLID